MIIITDNKNNNYNEKNNNNDYDNNNESNNNNNNYNKNNKFLFFRDVKANQWDWLWSPTPSITKIFT